MTSFLTSYLIREVRKYPIIMGKKWKSKLLSKWKHSNSISKHILTQNCYHLFIFNAIVSVWGNQVAILSCFLYGTLSCNKLKALCILIPSAHFAHPHPLNHKAYNQSCALTARPAFLDSGASNQNNYENQNCTISRAVIVLRVIFADGFWHFTVSIHHVCSLCVGFTSLVHNSKLFYNVSMIK